MSPLLDALLQAALAAGAVILRHYEAGTPATAKADGSPVTEADREAEAVILSALRRFDPAIPVVAEEEAEAGRLPTGDSTRFFLVDPLDGTREFVGRNGDFTVNIALVEDGVPVAGIVFAPVCGRLFLGEGGRAFETAVEDGRAGPLRPIAVRAAPARPVAVASRSHPTPETSAWLQTHAITQTMSRGSSLKFCLLAAGEADVYPRFGRTMEWDTAAGDAVLRAAGGRVVTLDGAPLRYGKRRQPDEADYANPHFLAFGDPHGLAFCDPGGIRPAPTPANPAAV